MDTKEFLKTCPACNKDYTHSCEKYSDYIKLMDETYFSFVLYKEGNIEHHVILTSSNSFLKFKTYDFSSFPEKISFIFFDIKDEDINNLNELKMFSNKILNNMLFM